MMFIDIDHDGGIPILINKSHIVAIKPATFLSESKVELLLSTGERITADINYSTIKELINKDFN